jgi:hypothetical protein
MPFHRRQWRITDVATTEELASAIMEYASHCLCAGFRCNGLLWLNDSTTPDTYIVQEWAIVRERDGLQCESISFWIEGDARRDLIIEEQEKYANGARPMFGEGQNLEPGALDHGESCRNCA